MSRALRRNARPRGLSDLAAAAPPTILQQTSAYIDMGVATLACSLTSAATAGNALLWVAAMDKSPGTLTMSGTGWATPINLRSSSVSLAASWKTAAGGETSLSGSVGGTAPPSGSRVWVAELAQSGVGAWTVVSATNNSSEATVSSWDTGTTAAVTVPSLAIALWAIDSVQNRGSSWTYTSGYTQVLVSATTGDGGEAGLWVATSGLAVGDTAGATVTRSGGTADQMTGGVLAIGRA